MLGEADGTATARVTVTDATPFTESSEFTTTVISPLGSVHTCEIPKLAWWSDRSIPTPFHLLIPTTLAHPVRMVVS